MQHEFKCQQVLNQNRMYGTIVHDEIYNNSLKKWMLLLELAQNFTLIYTNHSTVMTVDSIIIKNDKRWQMCEISAMYSGI